MRPKLLCSFTEGVTKEEKTWKRDRSWAKNGTYHETSWQQIQGWSHNWKQKWTVVTVTELRVSCTFVWINCCAVFQRPSHVPVANVIGHLFVVSEDTVATHELDVHTAGLLMPVFHFPLNWTKIFLLHHTWIHCLRVSQLLCSLILSFLSDKFCIW